MKVWLAQCLCPDRHAILANVGEAEDEAAAQAIIDSLRVAIDGLLANRVLNPWCGLCHAPFERWVYEVKPTRFATLGEAMPTLAVLQLENIAAGTSLGELFGLKSRTKH